MDFSVKDFNVRLRTIRLREALIAIILAFIISMVLLIIFPIPDETGDILFGISLFLILLFFIWSLRGTHGLGEDFSRVFERDNFREIIYIMILNILFASIVVAFFSSFDALYNLLYPETPIPMLDFIPTYTDPISFILDFILSVFFAPVLEELFFRGVLFNRLKIRTGIVAAMIISSFIFAIGHEFGGITSAFLFGMCMCVIYLKTDNILMTISIHFLNNLLAVILEAGNFDAFLFQMPFVFITFLVSILSGLFIIIYLYRETKVLTAS